jgi:hypothetical protein
MNDRWVCLWLWRTHNTYNIESLKVRKRLQVQVHIINEELESEEAEAETLKMGKWGF